jgi:arylsulfatase A-like enzyme
VERRCPPPAKPGSPNVVLIFSDDLGYSDLPKFGKSEIPTPNIDRLAQEGTLFTNACVTAPITVEPDGVADAGFVLPSI